MISKWTDYFSITSFLCPRCRGICYLWLVFNSILAFKSHFHSHWICAYSVLCWGDRRIYSSSVDSHRSLNCCVVRLVQKIHAYCCYRICKAQWDNYFFADYFENSQRYHIIIESWLEGEFAPTISRRHRHQLKRIKNRNATIIHFYC